MWFENDYRRIFMDMHFNDSRPEEYLSKLDVDNFVKILKKSNATSVVVKAKSHVGLHYWPSKYGKMHEGLKRRNLDYVGDMIEKCHKQEIAVILYFSQIFDNYAYDQHPEWRMVYPSCQTSREDGSGYLLDCPKRSAVRYGLVCPNNLEYRQYVKEILEELIETYQFEGFFMDMPFWPGLCHCASCRKRFLEETGMELPMKEDWEDPRWVQYVHSRQEWIKDFIRFTSAVIKNKNPEISIEHNASAVASGWQLGNQEKMLDYSDYAGGDYYGGYLQQSFICKYYHNVTNKQPFAYITSRCDSNLYTHTVSRCREDLMIHVMNALIHNGAFSMVDAMNPDGTISEKVYETTIGPVYKETAKYEEYVGGEWNADVAVWFNTNLKCADNFIQSPLNMAKILREYNIPYDVVGSKNLKKLKTKALCINDVYEITDEEMEALEAYVFSGGNIFVTGHLAHSRLREMVGVNVWGISEYENVYFDPKEEAQDIFETFDHDSPYPLAHQAIESNVIGDAEVLATLTYPYTRPGDKDFAAIHTDPPGQKTNFPAVVYNTYGKGHLIWAAAPMELAEAYYCKKVVYQLIKRLVKDFSIYSNAPEFVEIVSWDKKGRKYVAVLNLQEAYPVYPLQNITVRLPGIYQQIRFLTEKGKPLTVCYEKGNTMLTLPELELFHIIELCEN